MFFNNPADEYPLGDDEFSLLTGKQLVTELAQTVCPNISKEIMSLAYTPDKSHILVNFDDDCVKVVNTKKLSDKKLPDTIEIMV